MEYLFIVIRQVLIMLLYMSIGYFLCRKNLISSSGSRSIANLLLYCILPCVIIKSFCVERTAANTRALLVSFILGFLLLLLSILISALFLHKQPIDSFSGAFSNAGFMGFPLVAAVLGENAVFYVASYVALLNVLQWTYGQWILGNSKEVQGRALLKNPILLSLVTGLAVFSFQVSLPSVILTALSGISALNAPIAMIVLGVYLAHTDLANMIQNSHLYWVSFIRLLLIPSLSLLCLLALPTSYRIVGVALLLAAGTPVGSNVAVYAQKLNLDSGYAVQEVCISTLLSILTLPILAAFAGTLL